MAKAKKRTSRKRSSAKRASKRKLPSKAALARSRVDIRKALAIIEKLERALYVQGHFRRQGGRTVWVAATMKKRTSKRRR
jgi:hypothetical protein